MLGNLHTLSNLGQLAEKHAIEKVEFEKSKK